MPKLKTTEVYPNIHIRAHTYRLGTDAAYEGLRALGIRMVLNVATSPDLPLWRRCYADGVVTYIHRPIKDSEREVPTEISELAGMVSRSSSVSPVLVHCFGGINRCALVAGMAARLRSGMSGAEVLALLRSKRNRILVNPLFAKYLEELP